MTGPQEPRHDRTPRRFRLPAYLLSLIALVVGIMAGGVWPGPLASVAGGTRAVLDVLILLVPLLILGAVGPAVATLIRRGLAVRFAPAVLLWFLLTTVVAALAGMLIGAVVFPAALHGGPAGSFDRAAKMMRTLRSGGPTSIPVLAIATAVAIGILGGRSERVYGMLKAVEWGFARAGASLGYVMAPLILALGVMIGVTFGAKLGIGHYGTMIAYSAAMAALWCLFYIFILLRLVAGVRGLWPLVRDYFLPTALFAAGTCSSLATIPVNLAAAKRYGTRDEVADFMVPLGAVVHKEASAMQYMAYAPFIVGYVFHLNMSWSLLFLVLPFVVIYTMAAPGIPGAMGLGLWTAVLFASLMGLEDPVRTTFVGTWVALASGVPDMFRTTANSTCDGFAAILFSRRFPGLFEDRAPRVPTPRPHGAAISNPR